MKLKDILLKDDERELDEDLLSNLGEFVDMLDEDLITDDMENIIEDIFDKYMSLLEKLDIDNISEEIADHLDYILDIMELNEDDLDEAAKVKVIRKGKMIKRLPPRKGYKVVGNKYVRMKPSESKTRSRSAKKGARKSKAKNATKQRQMKKSLRKRKGRKL